MIELLKGFPDNVVAAACQGQITKNDYDTVLVPAVEKALKSHDKVRFYYEAGADSPASMRLLRGRTSSSAWSTSHAGSALRWSRMSNGSSKR